ncbi:MAG: hypothetical protein IIY08_02615 [Cellulosilyticum sp.]|nr:hypothetical protein [Cellulosilyticum sp.]
MKKIFLLVACCMTLLFGMDILSNPFSKSIPAIKTIQGPVLIDRLNENDLKMILFYSDISSSHIEAYTVDSTQVTPLDTTYTSYTEGFIENSQNLLLLEAVNNYRALEGLEPISYYHNYIEINGYGFLSLTKGLSTLYIIDLSTYAVTCPTFDSAYALDEQYIYQISEGEDCYYILSAAANSYKAYWYALNKNDFSLSDSKQLSPPSKALYRNQYAIDETGTSYFIGNHSLLIMTLDETINLPLSFNPDSVYFNEGKIYTFSTSELFLSYAIYDPKLGLEDTRQVNLPNKFVTLIGCHIKDDILYTLTYDETHPLYRNYITLYNLKDHNMMYCLALKLPKNMTLALQDAHYD